MFNGGGFQTACQMWSMTGGKYIYLKRWTVNVEALLGRQADCASASSAVPPLSSSRVVNKCGAVSQTADSSRRRPA